ncbi:unnamed protein product, partial [Iphiclides podalirius]
MDCNNEYFTSYEDLEIHRLMLDDSSRTETYRMAIDNNKEYFRNRVVMDVGCGTGILSLFCAQAGAKKVYAVEASNIAIIAKEIIKENGFENVVEVIQGKVEDIELPNNIKVDAIVSEWMGFYLLHEGMLNSVLAARDKFLKNGGEMFPESATMYVAPCSVPSLYHKWKEFHGVSMGAFAKYLRMEKHNKPEIMQVQSEDLLGDKVSFGWINLKEDNVTDLQTFKIEHVVGVNRNGKYQGLCIWFDCTFPQLSEEFEQIVLSTSPQSPSTHWKQTVILLPEEQDVEDGEPIAFQLDMFRDNLNERRYNIQVSLLDPNEVEHPVPCSCDMTKCILTKAFIMQQVEQPVQKITHEENSNNILEYDDIDD